jgi:phosphatidylinositol alpha-mannosyltransferase
VKILHIDPDDIDNPLAGGGPERTWQVYRRLAARHEITVLTPTFEGSTPELVRDGVRFVRLGRKVGDHGSSHHISFFLSLPSAVLRFEYDLLVEDLMPPMSATWTPLFNRKPLIASVQWFFAESLSRQYHLPFFLGERYGIRLYPNLLVQTEAMRLRIESLHPGARCEVIPAGASDDLFDLPIRAGEPMLYLGRIDFAQKGLDLLLRAFASIPPEERVPLVIAGHGFQSDALERLVAELELGPWVSAVGRVGREERARLLAGCRFVCAPSREETFGMVIIEACAAGKPVVLFDRAPMNEVAAEACERVPAFDVHAYAEAMRRLLRLDAGELEARGAACRAWAGAFRWDRIARLQSEFYGRVVDRARR